MRSSYRLGDLVFLNLEEHNKSKILFEYPNSIASRFIKENNNNIDIITKIILNYIEEVSHLLPKDIEESTVIHLRLGDVIAGNKWHERQKRPLEINYLKSLIENDTNPKYVIGRCFFADTSSNNIEECIELSNKYLKNVLEELNATHFDSGNADIDLCCAIKSKLFIQGKGYFSKLIVEVRKKLNLNNIETTEVN
uniref:Uncharacterized protein n=1 Tax=viral metagenome TaxID=1070528 RepID=A0A6C0CGY3_9ZZZZ